MLKDIRHIRHIEDLTPDPRNANEGSERGLYLIEKSIEQLGAGRSIVADRDGQVIAGNKTLQAAVDAGLDIQVVQTDGHNLVVVQRTDLALDDPDDDRARLLAYADNRASEIGLAWDAQVIADDLAVGLNLSDYFRDDELQAIVDAHTYAIPSPDDLLEQYGDYDADEEQDGNALKIMVSDETLALWQAKREAVDSDDALLATALLGLGD